ncbi:MAG: hypothetical protein E7491_02965 [Ruminococcaceae bacterium]|nr:hypothetical protein [Oscillospiraceae bacterium]
MKNKGVFKIARFTLTSVALIFEALPLGAVLYFLPSPESERVKYVYSYFSLIPFGYANFGPFLTALLSCLLLVVILISLFSKKTFISFIAIALNLLAIVTSFMPLMFSIEYFPPFALAISLLLIASAATFLIELSHK